MLCCDKTSKWTLPEGAWVNNDGDILIPSGLGAWVHNDCVSFTDEALCRQSVKAGLVMPPDEFYAGPEGLKLTDAQEQFAYADEGGVYAVGLPDGRTWVDRECAEFFYFYLRFDGAVAVDAEVRGVVGAVVSKGKTYLPAREEKKATRLRAAELLMSVVKARRAKKASGYPGVYRQDDCYVLDLPGCRLTVRDGENHVTVD